MNSLGLRAASLAIALASSCGAPAQATCNWNLFPTANPKTNGNQLTAVSGTSPNDVWETGAAFYKSGSLGYALHWNGHAWTSFAQTNPQKHGGQFSGVAAQATDDVWTVGQLNGAAGYAARRADAEFWNGRHFSASPLPVVAGQETFLYGVTAVTPGDVWAVGGALPSGGRQAAYVVHWDGGAWTRSAALNVADAATNLDAVASTSTTDVWTVGGSQINTASPFRTLAQHWDGARWSIVPTPNVNAFSNVFNAVVALAPDDAWAIGDYFNGKAFSPLAEHWNGTAWQIVPTPDSGKRRTFIFGATGASSHEVWAVGETTKAHGVVVSYILRWDGAHWAEVPSPNVPHRPATLLNAVTTIPRGGTWAVGGDANTKIVIDTVTEVRICAKDSALAHR